MADHIKSKQRVREQGEVFTQEREVNAMLDLVKNETERIESRFLEPACGNGNFLAPILERKLAVVNRNYRKSQLEYERRALVALGSVYGVELMHDNVLECRGRLFGIFEHAYRENFKKRVKAEILQSARKILEHNIRQGDALTLKDDNGAPIVFAEWTLLAGSNIKRHDYYFAELSPQEQNGMFTHAVVSDEGKPVFIPKSFKSYPLMHMSKIGEID